MIPYSGGIGNMFSQENLTVGMTGRPGPGVGFAVDWRWAVRSGWQPRRDWLRRAGAGIGRRDGKKGKPGKSQKQAHIHLLPAPAGPHPAVAVPRSLTKFQKNYIILERFWNFPGLSAEHLSCMLLVRGKAPQITKLILWRKSLCILTL